LSELIRSTNAPGKLFSMPNRTPIFFIAAVLRLPSLWQGFRGSECFESGAALRHEDEHQIVLRVTR
jgi:hypothetical protein